MFSRIAELTIRRPRLVLLVALFLLVGSALFGATAIKHLSAGGFVPRDAESTAAANYLAEHFDGGENDVVVLISAGGADGVDGQAATAEASHVAQVLRANQYISGVQSYWETHLPAMASRDKSSALITANVAGDDATAPARAADLQEQLAGTHDGVTVKFGGQAYTFAEVNKHIEKELLIAEVIAIPLTTLVLFWVFGSLYAALLPLVIGMFSITATMAILRGFSMFTDVSVYAMNMTTAMGLALAIDYSLFMVSRFREEMAAGRDVDTAIRRTVATAGRTVVFSSATVALSLSALVVFPVYFLKSFAYTGLAVVGMAGFASLIILPALFKLLGNKVNEADVRAWLRRRLGMKPHPLPEVHEMFWYKASRFSIKHAAPVAIAVIAFLAFVGSPVLNMAFGYPDDRTITNAAEARQVGDVLRADYDYNAATNLIAVLPDFADPEGLQDYATRLSQIDGVEAVVSSAGIFQAGEQVPVGAPANMSSDGSSFLSISTDTDPFSKAGTAQLAAIRELPAPVQPLITGPAAMNKDAIDALTSKLALALVLIALTTLVALWLFTGSLVLPLKALLLNTLSLSAMFGAMVWVFQEGHASGLLGFTATNYLVPTMPILMFCLAFGMSMDYEVFLLSRVREEWLNSDQSSAANDEAVALGAARTGRIITAAAILMAIVFISMLVSTVSFMKLFGLGMTLVILTDATIIRGVLVPSLMRLMGRFNWWSPKPLTALHNRIGLREHLDDEPAPPAREPQKVSVG